MDRSSPTAEDFNNLLAWLDPDRQRAAEKYETIRQQLVKIFTWRRAYDPEELADETITRVMRKLSDIAPTYVGDPRLYFYGVAKKLLIEDVRKRRALNNRRAPEADNLLIDTGESREQLYDCVEKCLLTLPADDRELLLTYHEISKQGQANARKDLAARMGLEVAVLRMRVYRIMSTLEGCVQKCMKSHEGSSQIARTR